MKSQPGKADAIRINRAPVLTLWAAVVAERLGFDRNESMTLGRAVAGLNAYSKGVSIGLFQPKPKALRARKAALEQGETIQVELLHRSVPCQRTPDGLRALSRDRPISPKSVQRYLESKFGDSLDASMAVMKKLAGAFTPTVLAERAYDLYEAFRPEIPRGKRGWGAAGVLDLEKLRALAIPR
ncbi:MAG TPA: hypothetical protein VFE84_14640 [Patescibacteria group bacterium]|nr:hypothetical protein [Patescibacteria group bacterium]